MNLLHLRSAENAMQMQQIVTHSLLNADDTLLSNTKKLFTHNALAEQYHHEGYVIIPDFVNTSGLENLRQLHKQYAPRLNMAEKSIYSNFEENPKDINYAIEQGIYKAFASSIAKHFRNYQIYGGSFLIKGYGSGTQTDVHQDWSAVDETLYPAFSIWVPLQDVDETTGCLAVVPGSHKWAHTIRGVNFPSVYVKLDKEAARYAKYLPVKAGCAVVYGMNTFHASVPNLQGSERGAVHLVLTNQEAALIHYLHEPENNRMAVVDCSRNFMYDFIFDITRGKYPAATKVLRYLSYTNNMRLTEAQWLALTAARFS